MKNKLTVMLNYIILHQKINNKKVVITPTTPEEPEVTPTPPGESEKPQEPELVNPDKEPTGTIEDYVVSGPII